MDYEVRARVCPVSPDATPLPRLEQGTGRGPTLMRGLGGARAERTLSLKINDDTSSASWLLGHLASNTPDGRVCFSSAGEVQEGQREGKQGCGAESSVWLLWSHIHILRFFIQNTQ